jgi:L-ascorbate metabolism protein UlaG (beta-lactamase superfamily)
MKNGLRISLAAAAAFAPPGYQEDEFNAGEGATVKIVFLGHSTLMISFNKTIIHVDPVEQYANYTRMPKADLVLVTHEHPDHLSPSAISAVRTAATQIICSAKCAAMCSAWENYASTLRATRKTPRR